MLQFLNVKYLSLQKFIVDYASYLKTMISLLQPSASILPMSVRVCGEEYPMGCPLAMIASSK